jgi:hypothetical protein
MIALVFNLRSILISLLISEGMIKGKKHSTQSQYKIIILYKTKD